MSSTRDFHLSYRGDQTDRPDLDRRDEAECYHVPLQLRKDGFILMNQLVQSIVSRVYFLIGARGSFRRYIFVLMAFFAIIFLEKYLGR